MVRCRLQRAGNGSLHVAVSRNGSLHVAVSRNGSLHVAASRKWFAADCSEQEMVRCTLQRAGNGSLHVAASRNGSLQIAFPYFAKMFVYLCLWCQSGK